ncbi:MAG: hypothetical protein ACI8RZ_003332 [Myxococcota bacterium]|jgi:hypothetical protein
MISARFRLSRSAIKHVPYLLAEGAQVLDLADPSLQEGWRVSTEAGIGLAATAAVVPELAWGGHVSVFWKP